MPAPSATSPATPPATPPFLAARLDAVRERISRAETAAGRPAGSVALLAVSKLHEAAQVRAAHALGIRDVGENYVQEASQKMQALADLRSSLRWTLIGPLQANKTRQAAELFDAVLSVDRLKIAQRLSEQRPAWLPPLDVALQVNISGEASKSGVAPSELPALAHAVAQLPRLRLRGLMGIPAPADDDAGRRAPLRELRQLFDALREGGLTLDLLSMGMSEDLEPAVAEGSTQVRIGTAIFGPRQRPAPDCAAH